MEKAAERFTHSRMVVLDPGFERLGLADAAISTLCEKNVLVLTDDLDLYLALTKGGVEAINFNHIRPLNWQRS